MIEPNEAAAVLDWILTAACLQVTADRPPPTPTASTTALDAALAAHFAYLRREAPITHLAVCGLIAAGAPATSPHYPPTPGPIPDNLSVLRLAGAPGIA